VAKPVKTLKCENNHGEEVRAVVKLKNAGFTEVAKPMPKGNNNCKLLSLLIAFILLCRTFLTLQGSNLEK